MALHSNLSHAERSVVGKNIEALRRIRGLTQDDLANELQTSRGRVSYWETGAGAPNAEMIVKLCRAMGVTEEQLLAGSKAPRTDFAQQSHTRPRP